MFSLWEYLVIIDKFILIILNINEYLIKFGRRNFKDVFCWGFIKGVMFF